MKPLLLRSGLTGRVYIATRYKHTADGIVVETKHDVTEEFEALVAERDEEATS